MAVSNPYYEGVKVNKKAVKVVRDVVKEGFYSNSRDKQVEGLERIVRVISEAYNVTPPSISIHSSYPEQYSINRQVIKLPKSSSLISLLHELRHHIQYQANKCYRGHDKEEDARAWSIRVFKVACPKSFEKSIKANTIMHIEWDGEKVVNSRGY